MFGVLLAGIIIVGFILGKALHAFIAENKRQKFGKAIFAFQTLSIFLLLFMMGFKIGANRELISNFSTIGVHAVLFGIFALAGSSLATWLFIYTANKIHLKKKKKKLKSHVPFSVEEESNSSVHSFIMIGAFLGLVVLGAMAGYYKFIPIGDASLENIVDFSLFALVFFIGIDMGLSQLNMEHLKSIGKSAALICLGVITGSVAGAVTAGALLHYDLLFSIAVGAPMGWYSLAGIMLSKISGELGAMAFSANLVRELIAIAAVPLIGTIMPKESAIAACGATACDTTLPSIIKGLGRHYAVTGFACGIIISAVVPFFLSIIQVIYDIM